MAHLIEEALAAVETAENARQQYAQCQTSYDRRNHDAACDARDALLDRLTTWRVACVREAEEALARATEAERDARRTLQAATAAREAAAALYATLTSAGD